MVVHHHHSPKSHPGGDHLIPWSSSSLLAPAQLPVRATKQAAAAAASASRTQHLQLPVLGLFATKPVIVEQQLQHAGPESSTVSLQQHSSTGTQKQGGAPGSGNKAAVGHVTAAGAQQGVAQHQVASSERGYDTLEASLEPEMASLGPAVAAVGPTGASDQGVLAGRLARLQGLDWRRFHVVWPRLCLGSSHCNIQVGAELRLSATACFILKSISC